MKKYNDYQIEQNKLLYDFLLKKDHNVNAIEFIISSYCNQACEYCYLYKYGKEMYPPESNNFNNIVENFEILLNWLDKENFKFDTYDFFSGEYFNLPIWENLFEIIYKREKEKYEKKISTSEKIISIPTNGSFLLDDEKTKKIEKWMLKFKEINMDIFLSFSIEGPEEIEKLERPLKTGQIKNQDNFYNKFNDFRRKYFFTGHPMVTKNFVKNYKKNYDWWIDTIIEQNLTQLNKYGEQIYSIPMFLEVRDGEQWDEESLKNYKDFLFYVADKDFSTIHNKDLDDFAIHFFSYNIDKKCNGKYFNVQPYIINYPYLMDKLPCSIQSGPVFRVGDLAYVPCHRTCYPHFVYGYLIKENNQIIGIEANKPTLAFKIKNLNPNRQMLKCSNCPIRSFCLKGCLGSQYEHTNELFCAEERICDLYYTKYKTIHEIALKYNLYDWVEKSNYFSLQRKEFIQNARRIITEL